MTRFMQANFTARGLTVSLILHAATQSAFLSFSNRRLVLLSAEEPRQ
jgi:hypothetical protein